VKNEEFGKNDEMMSVLYLLKNGFRDCYGFHVRLMKVTLPTVQ